MRTLKNVTSSLTWPYANNIKYASEIPLTKVGFWVQNIIVNDISDTENRVTVDSTILPSVLRYYLEYVRRLPKHISKTEKKYYK